MSTKGQTTTDPQSVFNLARDSDEVFVLSAADPLAPAIIAEWARRFAKTKIDVRWNATQRNMDVTMLPADRQTYDAAMMTAQAMCAAQLKAGMLPESFQPDPALIAEVVKGFGGAAGEVTA